MGEGFPSYEPLNNHLGNNFELTKFFNLPNKYTTIHSFYIFILQNTFESNKQRRFDQILVSFEFCMNFGSS
jgi:hypothetical protein